MESLQSQDNFSQLEKMEAGAKSFVDGYSTEVLRKILHGEYPAEFASFSPKRIEVFERAACIVLDIRQGLRPATTEVWGKPYLERRIQLAKENYTTKQERVVVPPQIGPVQKNTYSWQDTEDDNARRRAIAKGSHVDGDILDDRWG